MYAMPGPPAAPPGANATHAGPRSLVSERNVVSDPSDSTRRISPASETPVNHEWLLPTYMFPSSPTVSPTGSSSGAPIVTVETWNPGATTTAPTGSTTHSGN